MVTRIQRLPEVLSLRGISRSKHYFDIKHGLWTSPVKMGARCAGWPEPETEAINTAIIAGKSNEEIKQLVSDLQAQRLKGGAKS